MGTFIVIALCSAHGIPSDNDERMGYCQKMLGDMGLNSSGGLSNVSNMMPPNIRPIMDSAMLGMAMYCGLTSVIANPGDERLMETMRSCDVIKNNILYADSYLEL